MATGDERRYGVRAKYSQGDQTVRTFKMNNYIPYIKAILPTRSRINLASGRLSGLLAAHDSFLALIARLHCEKTNLTKWTISSTRIVYALVLFPPVALVGFIFLVVVVSRLVLADLVSSRAPRIRLPAASASE